MTINYKQYMQILTKIFNPVYELIHLQLNFYFRKWKRLS